MPKPKALNPINSLSRTKAARAATALNDGRFYAFVEDLLDPTKYDYDIVDLCKRHDIGTAKFVEMWRDHQHASALLAISDKLADIYLDMIQDARSGKKNCPDCEAGTVKRTDLPCSRCDGLGVIRIPGDLGTRKLLLDLAGLVNKKAPTVVMQQNFSAPGSMESTSIEVSRVLDGKVEP